MSLYLAIPALVTVVILGWVMGMVTRKRADRWCPQCGVTLQCPDCVRAEMHQLERERQVSRDGRSPV
jgi:hypothetical protein